MSDNRSDGDRCNKKGHKTRVEPTGVVNQIKCLIATCDRINVITKLPNSE
jgi:hypothetical protein